MKRFVISALAVVTAAAATAVALAGEKRTSAGTAPARITICHKTGSSAFQRITVSSRAVTNSTSRSGVVLRAHLRHVGDAILPGSVACPAPSVTPAPSATPPSRITICHKTGSTTNPYRRITVSSRAVTNPSSQSGQILRGHLAHVGDLILPGTVSCPPAPAKAVKLTATLEPVQGASGSGSATVTIRLGQSQLCYTLTVSGLTDVTGAHIHRASTGAVVVPFEAPVTGTSSGCLTVDRDLLKEILAKPDAFYVNVHTSAYPNGQVRGTLTR